MALQSSGAISISQIKTELGSSSNSLRTLSAAAGKSTPDSMSEFYGYSAYTPPSLGIWGNSQSGAGTQANPYIITKNNFLYGDSYYLAYECGSVPGLEPYEFYDLYDNTGHAATIFTNQTNVAQKMHVTITSLTGRGTWYCNDMSLIMYFYNGPLISSGQPFSQGTQVIGYNGATMFNDLRVNVQNLVYDLNNVTVGRQYGFYLEATKWTYQIGVACGDGVGGNRYFDDGICGSFYDTGIVSVTYSIWFEQA